MRSRGTEDEDDRRKNTDEGGEEIKIEDKENGGKERG